MKRLTELDAFCNADIIGVESSKICDHLEFEEMNLVTDAINRLNTYERTGLLPAEIATMQRLMAPWISDNKTTEERVIDLANQLMDALEAGGVQTQFEERAFRVCRVNIAYTEYRPEDGFNAEITVEGPADQPWKFTARRKYQNVDPYANKNEEGKI